MSSLVQTTQLLAAPTEPHTGSGPNCSCFSALYRGLHRLTTRDIPQHHATPPLIVAAALTYEDQAVTPGATPPGMGPDAHGPTTDAPTLHHDTPPPSARPTGTVSLPLTPPAHPPSPHHSPTDLMPPTLPANNGLFSTPASIERLLTTTCYATLSNFSSQVLYAMKNKSVNRQVVITFQTILGNPHYRPSPEFSKMCHRLLATIVTQPDIPHEDIHAIFTIHLQTLAQCHDDTTRFQDMTDTMTGLLSHPPSPLLRTLFESLLTIATQSASDSYVTMVKQCLLTLSHTARLCKESDQELIHKPLFLLLLNQAAGHGVSDSFLNMTKDIMVGMVCPDITSPNDEPALILKYCDDDVLYQTLTTVSSHLFRSTASLPYLTMLCDGMIDIMRRLHEHDAIHPIPYLLTINAIEKIYPLIEGNGEDHVTTHVTNMDQLDRAKRVMIILEGFTTYIATHPHNPSMQRRWSRLLSDLFQPGNTAYGFRFMLLTLLINQIPDQDSGVYSQQLSSFFSTTVSSKKGPAQLEAIIGDMIQNAIRPDTPTWYGTMIQHCISTFIATSEDPSDGQLVLQYMTHMLATHHHVAPAYYHLMSQCIKAFVSNAAINQDDKVSLFQVLVNTGLGHPVSQDYIKMVLDTIDEMNNARPIVHAWNTRSSGHTSSTNMYEYLFKSVATQAGGSRFIPMIKVLLANVFGKHASAHIIDTQQQVLAALDHAANQHTVCIDFVNMLYDTLNKPPQGSNAHRSLQKILSKLSQASAPLPSSQDTIATHRVAPFNPPLWVDTTSRMS